MSIAARAKAISEEIADVAYWLLDTADGASDRIVARLLYDMGHQLEERADSIAWWAGKRACRIRGCHVALEEGGYCPRCFHHDPDLLMEHVMALRATRMT